MNARGVGGNATDRPGKQSSAGLEILRATLHAKKAEADLASHAQQQALGRNLIRREFEEAPDSALFGDDVAAVILDTTTTALGLWRMGRRGPNWHRVGKAAKYVKRDLLQFIAESANEPK